jgi:acetolactate synthase-1/2/3 large subunit
MRGGEAIVNALAKEGVKYVAGVSGDATYEVLDGIYDRTDIKPILTRHEQASVYMADGYARASGKIGIVPLVTKGPGNGNIIGALGNAYVDSVPMVVLQGQSPQNLYGKGTLQEAPHLDIVRGVTKWGVSITTPLRINENVRRCFTIAKAGKPGPVMLEIPMDISSAEFEQQADDYRKAPEDLIFGGNPSLVKKALNWLVEAENPLILAGQGVLWANAAEELKEFAEKLGIPVMTSLNGKSAFLEDHPLSLGLGGYPTAVYSSLAAKTFADKADVVIALGASFKEYATCQWLPIPKNVKLIHVDSDYYEFGKAYSADLSILGDVKLVLQQMLQELQNKSYGKKAEVEDEIAELRKTHFVNWKEKLLSDEEPINPYRITWEMNQVLMGKDSIVLHDAGTVRAYVAAWYKVNKARSFIGFGGNSAMGWSLPAAIGAKLACPEKEVICCIGDGSFGMTGMEVETACRHGVKIITIIFNNECLNAVKMGQAGNFDRRFMWTDLGGDFAKVGEGLGAFAQKVYKPEDIRPALERALASDKPALIEIMVKPFEPLPYAGPKPPYPGRPKGKK